MNYIIFTSTYSAFNVPCTHCKKVYTYRNDFLVLHNDDQHKLHKVLDLYQPINQQYNCLMQGLYIFILWNTRTVLSGQIYLHVYVVH
jgi:hypothetical protein